MIREPIPALLSEHCGLWRLDVCFLIGIILIFITRGGKIFSKKKATEGNKGIRTKGNDAVFILILSEPILALISKFLNTHKPSVFMILPVPNSRLI